MAASCSYRSPIKRTAMGLTPTPQFGNDIWQNFWSKLKPNANNGHSRPGASVTTFLRSAHPLSAEAQVSECKTVARHDFSQFHRQVVMEHRTCVYEGVGFTVLATGVDVWWELREQLLIKFSAYEFRCQEFGVNAGQLGPHAGFDHGIGELARGHAPHSENWLQSGIFQLLLAVCPYIGQEEIANSNAF